METDKIRQLRDRFWWLMKLPKEVRSEYMQGYVAGIMEAVQALDMQDALKEKEIGANDEK